MAEVPVSELTVVYPVKTARKRFAHSPEIEESFDRHCRGVAQVGVLPKAATSAFSGQHAFASVYELPGKSGKAIL
jgi:hypothetical protein